MFHGEARRLIADHGKGASDNEDVVLLQLELIAV